MQPLIKLLAQAAPSVFISRQLGGGEAVLFPIIKDISVHHSTGTALRMAKDVAQIQMLRSSGWESERDQFSYVPV